MIAPVDAKVPSGSAVTPSNEFAQSTERMVNKINTGIPGANGPRPSPPAGGSPPRTAGAGVATGQSDRVTLTDTARLLQALENALDDQPVLDTTRIEQARSALLSGDYKIDADSIANKLLELEGRQRP